MKLRGGDFSTGTTGNFQPELTYREWVEPNLERARLVTVPFGNLSLVVVSPGTVIPTSPQAALLERYALSRRDRDRSCRASQKVPSRH